MASPDRTAPAPAPAPAPADKSTPMPSHSAHDRDFEDPYLLSKSWGSQVRVELDRGGVVKSGSRVTRNEEMGLRLAKEHTTIPVPEVYKSEYTTRNGRPRGEILMEGLVGYDLRDVWDDLDDSTKEDICHQLWGYIDQLRKIPKPSEFKHLYTCGADGSFSKDIMLADLNRDAPEPILDDDALRARINERYLFHAGGTYGIHLPDLLPRTNSSVFTHGDISPRNIMIDFDKKTITGLLDWEYSGWYPDYWEYAKLQSQAHFPDYQKWMDRTKPQDWDISGLRKAWKVLF